MAVGGQDAVNGEKPKKRLILNAFVEMCKLLQPCNTQFHD